MVSTSCSRRGQRRVAHVEHPPGDALGRRRGARRGRSTLPTSGVGHQPRGDGAPEPRCGAGDRDRRPPRALRRERTARAPRAAGELIAVRAVLAGLGRPAPDGYSGDVRQSWCAHPTNCRCTCATPRREPTRRGREARREQLPLRLQPAVATTTSSGGEPVPGGQATAGPAVGDARRPAAATSAPAFSQLGAAAVVPGRPGQLGPRPRRRAAERQRGRRPVGRDRRARAGLRGHAARRAVARRGDRLPGVRHAVKAWSRAEWVEATLPEWRALVDPIAAKAVDAMGTMLAGEAARWPSSAPRPSSWRR